MKLPILTATIAALLLAPLSLHAVTDTWDGGGANDNLNNGANWVDGTAPASDLLNTDLIFAGVAGLAPNVNVAFSTRSVTFNNTAGAFVIDGLALSVGTGGITNDDALTMTFNNVVNFAGASGLIDAAVGGLIFGDMVTSVPSLEVTGVGATNFSNISTSALFTKSGTGPMTWTPNASTAFDIDVEEGTLTMGADGVADVFTSTASITLNNTSILNINESMTLDGARLVRLTNAGVNLATGKTLTIQNGGDFEVTGSFSNNTASTIAVTGAGSTLTTTSTLGLQGGAALNVAAGGSVASGSSLTIGTFGGDGTVTVDGAGSSLSATGITTLGLNGLSASVTFTNDSGGSFAGMNVSVSGVAGTSGVVSVQSGADVTATGLSIGSVSGATTGTVTVTGAGSTFALTGAATATIGAAITNTATLNVDAGGVFTSGTGLTTVNATGVIAIGDGTYNSLGDLTLNDGRLTRTSTGPLALAAGKTLTVQATGYVGITGEFAHTTASTINLTDIGTIFTTTSTLLVENGAMMNVLANANLFLGAAELRVGSGTVAVDGLGSTVTAGAVSVGQNGSAGTLTFRNNALGSLGAIGVSDSGVAGTSGLLQFESSANVSGTGLVIADSVAANTGTVTVTGVGSFLTLNGAATTSIGAASASTATLNVNSSGIFNSGTGLTTVNATGTIAIDGGTFNADGDVTLNGGRLALVAGTFALDAGRTFTVQAGGDAIFTDFYPYANWTASTILVTGAGSTLTASTGLEIRGDAVLNVAAGGSVSSGVSFDVATSTGDGTVTVDGAGSSLSTTGFSLLGAIGLSASVTFTNESAGTFAEMYVGSSATNGTTGVLSVQSGADVTTGALSIGIGLNTTTGTVTVSGAGSTFALTGAATLSIGATTPDADLNVNGGGLFESGTGLAEVNASGVIAINGGTFHSRGPLTLDGGQLTRSFAGVLHLDAGTVFTVQAGGDAIITGAYANPTASTIRVTGAGSTFSTTNLLTLNGGSVLNVLADGDVNAGSGLVLGNTGVGTATVDGAGSTLNAPTITIATSGGTGALTFSNGSAGTFGTIILAQSTSAGTTGLLTIQSGADVAGTALILAPAGGAATTAVASVNGAGSTLTLNSATVPNTIGAASGNAATLNVQAGGEVTTTMILGTDINATGRIAIGGGTFNSNNNVTITGGTLTRDATGIFTLGNGRTLALQNGGDVFFTGSYSTPNSATISVNGAGSHFSTSTAFSIGGGAAVNAAAGGDISAGTVNVGSFGGSGTASIDGAGSTLDAPTLAIGLAGQTGALTFSNGAGGTFTTISVDVSGVAGTSGTLTIQSGATVSGANLSMATTAAANSGSVLITGAGSQLIITGSGVTTIGAASGSSGILNIESGGTFITGTGVTNVRATGEVNVNAGGTMIVHGDMNVATSLDIGSGGVVILGGSPPAAPEFDFGVLESGVQTAVVPEPGVGALLVSALGFLGMRRGRIRGARASRVLVSASRRNELPCAPDTENVRAFRAVEKVREGGTPSPTLGTSVLPGVRGSAFSLTHSSL